MKDTPTPETDASYKAYLEWEDKQAVLEQSGSRDFVWPKAPSGWEVARKLERERDQLRKQVEMDTECITRIQNHGYKNEVELEQLREVVDKLECALGCGCGGDHGLCKYCAAASHLYSNLPHVIEKGKQ